MIKKALALLLALSMTVTVVGCGKKEENEKTADDSASAEATVEMPWEIEPLKEKVTLKVGNMASTSPHLPTYIAQQKGWLEEAGIEIESVLFNSGPAMMEACSAGAWDCGSTGIGASCII